MGFETKKGFLDHSSREQGRYPPPRYRRYSQTTETSFRARSRSFVLQAYRSETLYSSKKHKAMPGTISTTVLVSIVDDDESVRVALKGFMQSVGFAAESFSS